MTKYFEFVSAYQATRKLQELPSPLEFYNNLCHALELAAAEQGKPFVKGPFKDGVTPSVPMQLNPLVATFNRSYEELKWYELGTPYYKVDTEAIELFKNINLDIPFKYVRPPFETFAIRFQEENPLIVAEGRPVRAMLVSKAVDGGNRNCMDFWFDCGEREEFDDAGITDMPVLNYLHVIADDEALISERIARASANGGNSEVNQVAGLEAMCVRIAVAVCFLATSADKMIRPDVLSKDLGAWAEAERKKDTARMGVIAERAKRRGKLGYYVDGSREFIHTRHEDQESSDSTGGDRHLHFRHMRSAHFRLHHGGKVAFVRMHPVRPDLPAPPV